MPQFKVDSLSNSIIDLSYPAGNKEHYFLTMLCIPSKLLSFDIDSYVNYNSFRIHYKNIIHAL